MSNIQKVMRTDENGVYMLASQLGNSGQERVSDVIADAAILLEQSLGQSRVLVEKAQAEARETTARVKEQGYAKGYEEGYRQGSETGMKKAMDERQGYVDQLASLSERFAQCFSEPGEDNRRHLGEALELARRIIRTELNRDEEAIFGLYKKAATHISNVDSAVLKVGPRGYEVVCANKKKFEDAIEGLNDLKVVLMGQDDGLCQLETALGNIDASVGAQLQRAQDIISPQS